MPPIPNPAPEVLIPRRGALRADDEHGNVDADDQTLLACVSTQYRPAAVSRFYQTAMTKQLGVGNAASIRQRWSAVIIYRRSRA